MKQPAVYIMANKPNGTIYVGVTSDLIKRAYLHRNSILDGFSKKYACKSLVYFEIHQTMESAILREKQLKAGSRQKKIELNVSFRHHKDWTRLFIFVDPTVLDCHVATLLLMTNALQRHFSSLRAKRGSQGSIGNWKHRLLHCVRNDKGIGHFLQPTFLGGGVLAMTIQGYARGLMGKMAYSYLLFRNSLFSNGVEFLLRSDK